MDVTLDQCKKLVADAQLAHRLLVAYYERLTSRLDAVAQSLEARFFRWDPAETSRPCRAKTPPSRNWLWDMVPLYAAFYCYGKMGGNTIRAGDFAVCFMVYTDDAFDSDRRKNSGLRGKPDPLAMEAGEGVIVVDVYLAERNIRKTWDELWDDLEDPVPDTGHWIPVGNDVKSLAFKMSLASFMHKPSELQSRVAELVAQQESAGD